VAAIVDEAAPASEEDNTPDQPKSDPFDQFDPGRKARQATLAMMDEVLAKAASGSKVDQKKLTKVLFATRSLLAEHERLVCCLMGDIYNILQMHQQHGNYVWGNSTRLKSLLIALEEKNVVTEAEVSDINTNRVVPESMEKMKQQLEAQEQDTEETPTDES